MTKFNIDMTTFPDLGKVEFIKRMEIARSESAVLSSYIGLQELEAISFKKMNTLGMIGYTSYWVKQCMLALGMKIPRMLEALQVAATPDMAAAVLPECVDAMWDKIMTAKAPDDSHKLKLIACWARCIKEQCEELGLEYEFPYGEEFHGVLGWCIRQSRECADADISNRDW